VDVLYESVPIRLGVCVVSFPSVVTRTPSHLMARSLTLIAHATSEIADTCLLRQITTGITWKLIQKLATQMAIWKGSNLNARHCGLNSQTRKSLYVISEY
jgi:hypothetical protein